MHVRMYVCMMYVGRVFFNRFCGHERRVYRPNGAFTDRTARLRTVRSWTARSQDYTVEDIARYSYNTL